MGVKHNKDTFDNNFVKQVCYSDDFFSLKRMLNNDAIMVETVLQCCNSLSACFITRPVGESKTCLYEKNILTFVYNKQIIKWQDPPIHSHTPCGAVLK